MPGYSHATCQSDHTAVRSQIDTIESGNSLGASVGDEGVHQGGAEPVALLLIGHNDTVEGLSRWGLGNARTAAACRAFAVLATCLNCGPVSA